MDTSTVHRGVEAYTIPHNHNELGAIEATSLRHKTPAASTDFFHAWIEKFISLNSRADRLERWSQNLSPQGRV